MYWVKNTINGIDHFEVLDGQQRTISICQYVIGDFTVKNHLGNREIFDKLPGDFQEQILNYKLMVYFCEGTDSEKLEWFKTINIAGKELSPQELRNAVYTGTWLADAKRKFSKNNCAAYLLGKEYINAKRERQEYLELALAWINDGNIEDYIQSSFYLRLVSN